MVLLELLDILRLLPSDIRLPASDSRWHSHPDPAVQTQSVRQNLLRFLFLAEALPSVL